MNGNIERTGERDLMFSSLHRCFGEECKMIDLDFYEYQMRSKKPLALCETKIGLETEMLSFQRTTLCKLAEPRTETLPVFLFNRNERGTEFRIRGINQEAKDFIKEIFVGEGKKDFWYWHKDGSVRANIVVMMRFIQLIHSDIKNFTYKSDYQMEISQHMAKVNPMTVTDDPIDLEALLTNIVDKKQNQEEGQKSA